MNLRRVAPGDWAVGLCGAVLIGSLWLPWYRIAATAVFFRDDGQGSARALVSDWQSVNAWQAMAVNDLIFLIVGALAIGLVIAGATQASGAVPIANLVFAALGGILVSILTLVRLIWPPDLGPGPTDRAGGVWIAAAASLGLAAAALFAMRDERRGAFASPEVTVLPAPKADGA